METLCELLKEFLQINPGATDDRIIYQINDVKLTVGSIKKALSKECKFCERYNVVNAVCENCADNNYFELKLED